MKTKQTLKILLSSALFIFAVMTAQAQVENGDFEAVADGVAAKIVDSTSIGSTNGYYLMPDSYYHPNYTAAGSWALTAGFTWTWGIAPAGPTVTDASTADNYVEVTFPATGNFVLSGRELAPALYGGCTSTDSTVSIVVLDTASFSVTPATGVYIAPATDTLEVCEGDAALVGGLVGVDIVDNIGNGANFNLIWDLTIFTLMADHTTPLNYYQTDESTTLGAGVPAVSATAAAPTVIADPGTYDLQSVDDGTFSAIGGASTVYRYTVNAINDRLSRKGEYLSLLAANAGVPGFATTPDDFTYYGVDDEEFSVVIIVNPTPVTGPIYHIPNNWAN